MPSIKNCPTCDYTHWDNVPCVLTEGTGCWKAVQSIKQKAQSFKTAVCVIKPLDGDIEAIEQFLKNHSDYGPLFCAWERIKRSADKNQKKEEFKLLATEFLKFLPQNHDHKFMTEKDALDFWIEPFFGEVYE